MNIENKNDKFSFPRFSLILGIYYSFDPFIYLIIYLFILFIFFIFYFFFFGGGGGIGSFYHP